LVVSESLVLGRRRDGVNAYRGGFKSQMRKEIAAAFEFQNEPAEQDDEKGDQETGPSPGARSGFGIRRS
jgi:hypothetical protein